MSASWATAGLCCTCSILVAAAAAGCEGDLPDDPPPGACQAGEKVCYHEPVSDRDYVLRCNTGEVEGAIWLIDQVCVDGATCEVDRCVPPGGAP